MSVIHKQEVHQHPGLLSLRLERGWASQNCLCIRRLVSVSSLMLPESLGDEIRLLLIKSIFSLKPSNSSLLFLFSLQLWCIFTLLWYSSQMRLHCIASDLYQKELQMFQRKCAETVQLKQNKLCLKSRKCPNKWEMHQFLLELFSLLLPPVFIFYFLFLFYFMVWYSSWFFQWKSLS